LQDGFKTAEIYTSIGQPRSKHSRVDSRDWFAAMHDGSSSIGLQAIGLCAQAQCLLPQREPEAEVGSIFALRLSMSLDYKRCVADMSTLDVQIPPLHIEFLTHIPLRETSTGGRISDWHLPLDQQPLSFIFWIYLVTGQEIKVLFKQ
jgi:hypothetical protein